MAITEITGTEAVSTTEWSLATDTSYDTADAQTTDGVLQCWLDLSDMIAGDQLQIRVYEKCRSGDTQRICHERILTGAQAKPNIWLPALVLMHGWDVTCDALAGTITVNWSLRLSPATITEITGTGTITATEQSLATNTSYDTGDAQTDDCNMQVFIDANAIAAGDLYELSLYEKARTADTQRKAREFYVGPHSHPLHVFEAATLLNGWDVTAQKISGTDRALNWSIRKVAA